MSPKENRFVAEYLKDQNATQAAIRAGYSKRSAGNQGNRLMKNDEIKAAIDDRVQSIAEKVGASKEYVLAALKEVVERSLQRIPVMEFDYEEKRLVQKRDADGNGMWEFDAAGANGALRMLGQHHKLFTEVHEHGLTEVSLQKIKEGRERARRAVADREKRD